MSSTHTIPVLNAQRRTRVGTRDTGRLRAAGRLPAVLYGHGRQPDHVSFNATEAIDLLRHHAHIIDVSIDGQSEHCLVKDVQWNHLGATIIHMDLERVDLNQSVEVEVDVHLQGEAIGLKTSGAYLDHASHTLLISCLPLNVPEMLHVDISNLQAGHTLTAGEVKLPEGVTLAEDAGTPVAIIHIARALAEETPVAATGAEPEVIRRAKSEEAEA